MEMRVEQAEERWVEVDAWGQRLAGKRGRLDLEIGEWLLAARDESVHRRLGFASLGEYVERRLGLDAHSIGERIRVADMLGNLEGIRNGLAKGELS